MTSSFFTFDLRYVRNIQSLNTSHAHARVKISSPSMQETEITLFSELGLQG